MVQPKKKKKTCSKEDNNPVVCTEVARALTFNGHLREISTFVGHSGGMNHSPAPYTSNQIPFGELKKLPPFECAAHTTATINFSVLYALFVTVL